MRGLLTTTLVTLAGVGITLSPCIVPVGASFNSAPPASAAASEFAKVATGTTIIDITGDALEKSGKRFGINLGEQTFYGSGQMMKNLVFRNPGFEGMEYHSIVRCAGARSHACDDADAKAPWPEKFWDSAAYHFLSGRNAGKSGTLSSFAANPARFMFASDVYPATGDYVLLTREFPGDPTAGWWPGSEHGATFSAEFKDLPPHSPGKQSLRIDATATSASARLASYFDTYADGHPGEPPRSFLRMRGTYELRFRAKALTTGAALGIQVDRAGTRPFLQKQLTLTPAWQDYAIPFAAKDEQVNTHAVELLFVVTGASVLLDDVSLTSAADDENNLTAFRAPVVRALREFNPGILRLMASQTQLGSSIANLLAPPDARVRSGFSPWNRSQEDIPIGIPEFLDLCAQVHAEPWITLPTGTSPEDIAPLMRVLTQWQTNHASKIHLELGNEAWNASFAGETMEDPAAYGQHAEQVFRAVRAAAGFSPANFDLVIGGQAEWPERSQQILAAAGGDYDSIAIAPYLWRTLGDQPDDDHLFGPGMAEPELLDSYGQVHQTARYAASASHPARLAVYEVNLHTTAGSASQATLDRAVPSLAAGLAVAAHMLQMRRDDAVQDQLLFNLPEFNFQRPDGKSVRLWGSVVDLGPTEHRRPDFLALALSNEVASGTLLRTRQTGADPTFDARFSTDQPSHPVHVIQSFAFDLKDTHERALLVFNLSSKPQAIEWKASRNPRYAVAETQLTGLSPTSNNEDAAAVTSRQMTISTGNNGHLSLGPFSLTLLRWHLD